MNELGGGERLFAVCSRVDGEGGVLHASLCSKASVGMPCGTWPTSNACQGMWDMAYV
ncbi:hypothetical protein RBWH47_00277 [Rhodopirellula baltica WH47]|uniref:Uncharacterized protein n=1 Tax=Rhodopirellula baltica WH47 TaxID=991778 RepID=F2ATB6_RHOBT|nr:hypothetical protein RBWH47_00277 [Rhodopirellula baltica WH47]